MSSWLGGGVKLPPITNAVAKEWANFEKKKLEGSIGKIEDETERKSILKSAFNSQLNEDERDLYSLSETKLRDAYDRGLINDQNIEKALAVERQLFDAGLIDKETLARKLDLSARGYKGGKGGKGKKSKYDYTKNLFASSSTSNSVSKSLREILESAMKG
jgi:hypothetical protein